jgi:amidophosphoribosyltransferase
MPSRTELVAHARDEAEMAQAIGADLVIFPTLPDLINNVTWFNPELRKFTYSAFSGEYVTGDVEETCLARLEGLRSENAFYVLTAIASNHGFFYKFTAVLQNLPQHHSHCLQFP